MSKLLPVVIDLETFWSDTHTLKKINPVDYALHEETEIQSCSFTIPGKPTFVVFGQGQVQAVLDKLPAERVMAVGHNMSMFDSMILNWRLGFNPAMWACTQSMARALYAKETPLSLKALLEFLGSPIRKGNLEEVGTKGKKLADFTPDEIKKLAAYNIPDGDGCMWLFKRMVRDIGARELQIIDMNIRMLLDRKLRLDAPLLERTLVDVKKQKRTALLEAAELLGIDRAMAVEDRIELVRSQLASAPKFGKLLESYGFDVPMKASPTALKKGEHKLIPALSKTDDAMQELCEDDHPVVSVCAQTRLGVKSTQLESRIETLLRWNWYTDGECPVPLHYCGADTTGRDSGAMKANLQNLPRIGTNPDDTPKLSNALRESLIAPPGHKIVVADLSGIELRVNHFLWKVRESVNMYMADPEADLYKAFASARYGVPIEEVDKRMRQMGKVAHLGLGFGAGWSTFQKFAKTQYRLLIDDVEAEEIVRAWRYKYLNIVDGWKTCHSALTDIYNGVERVIDPWGLTHTCMEGIVLPSGRLIRYPQLHEEKSKERRGNEWWYGGGRHRARIYAGKVDENIVQALARDVIKEHALEFRRRTGVNPSLVVHDEIVAVVPTNEAESMLAELHDIMRTPPKWWPRLVLWSEGDIADRYSDAK